MTVDRARLELQARARIELDRRAASVPLIDRVPWLPGQAALYACRDKRKLLRAGNQAHGKTWAGARELIRRMQGVDGFRAPPIKAWVICGGGEQSQVVQEKVWELVPRELLAEGCAFDARKGAFLGKYPKLIFKNGSIAEFKSGQSDTINLAAGTLDLVWIDEPPESHRVYAELIKRLLKRNGDMILTMTPVNNPVEWIREECEAGRITDLHYELTVENLVPVGRVEPLRLMDGTVCDQGWIDRIIAETPPAEVPVTVHGGWEFRAGCAYFDGAWDPSTMVHDRLPVGEFNAHLGVDFGTQPGKQCAYLIAVQPSADGPSVYVLDEYVDTTGAATVRHDARGILDMLQRSRLVWRDLHCAYGDRVHMPGRDEQKSTKDLSLAILREMAQHAAQAGALNPQFRTAKHGASRGAGSVDVGGRWLRVAMLEGRFSVHPRCVRLVAALPRYTAADDDFKDPIDAVRYGMDPVIFAGVPRGPIVNVRIG